MRKQRANIKDEIVTTQNIYCKYFGISVVLRNATNMDDKY